MNLSLEGKVAIVTGSSRGLGKATAYGLAKSGAKVVVASRTEETGGKLPGTIHETVDGIHALVGDAIAIATDVSKPESIDNLITKTLEHFSKIDIVVHNAAAISQGRVIDTKMSRWDLVWNINLRATAALIIGSYPSMKKTGGGSIVIVTQRVKKRENGSPGFSPIYRLSKSASADLIEIMASEVINENIKINAIWPKTGRNTFGSSLARSRDGRAGDPTLSPVLFADAVVELVSQGSTGKTGLVLTDEDILNDSGITDFSKYALKTEEPEF
jgi:citronellol/citronellal dehydrogenase